MKSRDGKSKCYLTEWGNWRVRFFCEDGIARNKVCKSKTEADALVSAIRRRDELDYWFPEEPSAVSTPKVGAFKALAEKWLEHSAKVREISESCLMNYRGHLNHHILPVIGDRYLKDLTLRAIEEVAAVIKEKRPKTRSYVAVRQKRIEDEFYEDDDFLSASYRKEILTVACMVTKFGFERGYTSVNPFREFKLPDCPEQPYDYWRLDEEDSFLQWLEDGGIVTKEVTRPHSVKAGKPEKFVKRFPTRNVSDLYDVVLFALRSGLRKGEIGALIARDVNFAKNYIIVRRSYSAKEKRVKTTTKGGTYRIIEMNEDMKNILKRRIGLVRGDSELLFKTNSWAINKFSKYCAKAGVREIHFHSLRHTCLTNLANGYGMDAPLPLPQVQKIAGHKDIATTMRYVHVDGIENTASRQWSRERRKAMKGMQKAQPPAAPLTPELPPVASTAVRRLRVVN